jgi:mono/diheme cytochrome c family protein
MRVKEESSARAGVPHPCVVCKGGFFALALVFCAFGFAAFAQSPGKSAEQKKDQATVSPAGDAARGKTAYQRNCAICHHSASSAKKIGPGLKGVYKQKTFADGRAVTDDNMRAWIEDGGEDMPQFKNTLKPQQILDLIAYMKTL